MGLEPGRVLYTTHHFTGVELSALLTGVGFDVVRLASRTETSSRRKDEPFKVLACSALPEDLLAI